jgi:hypothetical protein
MRYNQEWLDRVQETKSLIDSLTDAIPQIPDLPTRALIAQQFNVVKMCFWHCLQEGRGTFAYECDIRELAALTEQLIEGAA